MSVYMYGGRKCTENEDNEDKTTTELVGRLSWPNDPKLKGCRKNTRLLDAVGNGDIERISRLLKLDASPNATCHLNCVSACHMAAMMDNESLLMLIAAGAQSFRTDELGRIPLHLAAWAGRPRQIAILLDFPEYLQNKVEVKISPKIELEIKKLYLEKKHLINVRCDRSGSCILPEAWSDSMEHDCSQFSKYMPEIDLGWTALHLACARVHYSCVQLLLAAGADCNALDVVGRTPLDVVGAAHHLGFPINIREFIDTIRIIAVAGGTIKDNANMNGSGTINTLLHTAVELESKEAVKELLKAGVSAISLNSNGLTPLHICVNRKLKKILQLIANFEYSNQHTQIEVVDAKDKNGDTFLGAAVRAQWIDGVRIAVGAGANVFIQANDGNSPFHFAAALGNVHIFQILLTVAKYSIDSPNQEGQTALFIAVAHNHLNIVKLLVSNGASFVTSKNKPNGDNCNVIHIAAEHGHIKILSFLLNSNAFYEKNLIDDITVVSRRTPLFYAVMNNHLDCVSLLLIHRAIIDILLPYKDSTGEVIETTVLHIAAAENYVKIAEVLLEFDSRIINKPNSVGLQPLHEACIHGNRHIIPLLIQKGADLSAAHPKVKTPIQILMNNLSKPTAFLEEIFDSYITTGLNIEDKDCKVKIDYRLLLPNSLKMKEVKVIEALVNTGNSYNQKTLLHHPLIESFLYLKWKSLLPFFYFIVGLYGCFVVSFNMYVMSVFFELDNNDNQYEEKPILFHVFAWKIMTTLTGGLIMVQIMFMKIMAGKRYFFFLETWTNFIATILAMFLPAVISLFSTESELMRVVVCITVLLTWLEMMFLLCRYPRWGFYVLMFGKVTAKVLKVLLTFGFLIIGFSICFMIQFRRKPPFETLWASVSKTLVMMMSEYDYSSTIDNNNSDDIGTHISILRLTFVAFVILASIVLMNLMIGVAVNDVNNLEKIGNQRRLEKQVDFLSSMEDVDKYIRKILPKRYYKVAIFAENDIVTLSPHKRSCKYYKLFPIHIREAIFEKAQSQKKQVDEVCSLALEKRLDEMQYSIDAIVRQNERLEQFSKDIMTKIQDHIKSIK